MKKKYIYIYTCLQWYCMQLHLLRSIYFYFCLIYLFWKRSLATFIANCSMGSSTRWDSLVCLPATFAGLLWRHLVTSFEGCWPMAVFFWLREAIKLPVTHMLIYPCYLQQKMVVYLEQCTRVYKVLSLFCWCSCFYIERAIVFHDDTLWNIRKLRFEVGSFFCTPKFGIFSASFLQIHLMLGSPRYWVLLFLPACCWYTSPLRMSS